MIKIFIKIAFVMLLLLSGVTIISAAQVTSSTIASAALTQNISQKIPVILNANFSASPTSDIAPMTVYFTDLSQGSPTEWKWDFGDGTTSTDQNPGHIYTQTGVYTVTLTVGNAYSLSLISKTNFINVVVEMDNLYDVKVASVYERVTEDKRFNRSVSTVTNIFKETNTDLIFRGFFRWQPVPESPTSIMPGYTQDYVKQYASGGYTYEQLKDAIDQIKKAKPKIIFVGAIAAQRINKLEFNDVTHESFNQSQTWEMALDPTKIDPKLTKENFQCMQAKSAGLIGNQIKCPSGYDPTTVPAYFPDITNEQYQELLISYAQKQIDLGADAIWIDMLYSQANYLTQMTGNPNDLSVKAAYDASSKIIDDIHAYGHTKYNKHIYIGTWSTFTDLPYSPSDVDFVTVAVSSQDIKNGLNDRQWNAKKDKIIGKIGNKPIIVFIDWSGSATAPMGLFSQLTPDQQKTFLISADEFFTKKGMIFAYPVHGGTFPQNSNRLSFGKFNTYDSLAPEFGTYETIKDLALKKSTN